MAHDTDLAQRVRDVVHGEPGLSEKRMFGAQAFLIHGNLAVGASSRGGLLLRIDPADTETLVNEPDVRRTVMRGRQLQAWLDVDPRAVETDDALEQWVHLGVAYARSLPPKAGYGSAT